MAPKRPARVLSIRDRITSAEGGRMSAERGSQTVLITGATDGLGKAAALLLAGRGYRVFAAGGSAGKRAPLCANAKEKKLPLQTLQLGVCNDNSVKKTPRSLP